MKKQNKGLEKLEKLLSWELSKSIYNKFRTIYIIVDEADKQAVENIVHKMF